MRNDARSKAVAPRFKDEVTLLEIAELVKLSHGLRKKLAQRLEWPDLAETGRLPTNTAAY
jgi:hypothetical protein